MKLQQLPLTAPFPCTSFRAKHRVCVSASITQGVPSVSIFIFIDEETKAQEMNKLQARG